MADKSSKCDVGSCGGNCSSCDGNITVTLTLDNDETVECAILTIFAVDGKDYIALLPLNDEGENEDGEVYLYRYISNDGAGQPTLENIEDDDEYDAVTDMFDQMLDAAEFDEIISEEDLDNLTEN